MTSYFAGSPATLTAQFFAYPSGPPQDVTGLTITIGLVGGSSNAVGPTGVGVTHVSTGVYAYTWPVPAIQTPGDYGVLWQGTVGSSSVQASEVITVIAAVSWVPDKSKVASYIPGRTLVAAVDGYGNPVNTFDTTTHPTGAQVDLLIADACAWVQVKAGAIDVSLNAMAAATAAVYAAAAVERGYPDANTDVNTAGQLWTQAVAMRDDLAHANEVLTGVEPEDPAANLSFVSSFPTKVSWGDDDFL